MVQLPNPDLNHHYYITEHMGQRDRPKRLDAETQREYLGMTIYLGRRSHWCPSGEIV